MGNCERLLHRASSENYLGKYQSSRPRPRSERNAINPSHQSERNSPRVRDNPSETPCVRDHKTCPEETKCYRTLPETSFAWRLIARSRRFIAAAACSRSSASSSAAWASSSSSSSSSSSKTPKSVAGFENGSYISSVSAGGAGGVAGGARGGASSPSLGSYSSSSEDAGIFARRRRTGFARRPAGRPKNFRASPRRRGRPGR
mmetsp:Transcript_21590/g.66335  ORF Transcript_21590/g.66335 Transcript_21590/m.66335 type:complete len:202 (+) Transcript_21590:216-821(+)